MSNVSIASHASWSTYDTFFIVLLSGRPVYDQNPLRPNPNLQKLVSCSCRIRGLGQTLTPLVLARWSWHNPHEGAPTTICYLNLISSIDYSIGRGDFKEVLKKHTKKKILSFPMVYLGFHPKLVNDTLQVWMILFFNFFGLGIVF